MKISPHLTVSTFSYSNTNSTEIAVPLVLPKPEFIDLWSDSSIPMDIAIARKLPLAIHMIFNYIYYYDAKDGTIWEHEFQRAEFREVHLWDGEFGPLIGEAVMAMLLPVLDYIEGQCSPFA